MRTPFKLASVILLSNFSLLGCKPTRGSQVQSLDDLAAGSDAHKYQCKVPANALQSLSPNEKQHIVMPDGKNCADQPSNPFCEAVAGYLGRLPKELRSNYFEVLGGNVKIVEKDNMEYSCAQALAVEGSPQFVPQADRRKVKSCYNLGGNILSIIHEANVDDIKENGLRAFGMFYAQGPSRFKLVTKEGGKRGFEFVPRITDDTKFLDKKRELATIFTKDLANLELKEKGKYSLERLKPLLSDKEIAALRSKSASPFAWITNDENLLKSNAADQPEYIRQQRLVDTIWGEAFDSYHCSTESSENALALFPNTKPAFTTALDEGIKPLAEGLRSALQTGKMSLAGAEGSGEGLGLAFVDPSGFFIKSILANLGAISSAGQYAGQAYNQYAIPAFAQVRSGYESMLQQSMLTNQYASAPQTNPCSNGCSEGNCSCFGRVNGGVSTGQSQCNCIDGSCNCSQA